MKKRLHKANGKLNDRSTELNTERVVLYLTETNVELLRKNHLHKSQVVNRAIDNYFTFNLTLYIIVHRISNKFHIGFFEDHEFHDLHWHYIHSTGSGTVGDEIRKEGFGRYKLEIIGKFGNLDHLSRIFRHYHKQYSKRGEAYESHLPNDNVEILLKTYMKRIGKYRGKKEKADKI